MGQRIILVSLLLLLFNHLLVAETQTANHQDFTALKSLMDNWKNMPPSWSGSDPCYEGWEGIKCTNSRVTSIALASMGLTGHLSGDIASLSELNTLDLSYNEGLTGSLPPVIGNLKKLSNLILVGCNFTGSIPENIGSLQQLVYLALNSNRFSGKIPASIGNLSKLSWLDLSYNQLEGPIPVSSGGSPGLDKLLIAKHFHLGNNRLSGTIPPQFFSSEMTLIHALFDSNQLNGSIPSTLGLVQSLEVVRFDSNLLSGSVPPNINNLTKVSELYLSNNKLIGPLPNLSELKSLSYLDMSNNSFDPSEFPPWLTTLRNLTTLKMEKTQLTGQIPASLFSLANLQTVELKHNDLNGTLDIGTAYSKHLDLIDLQDNKIDRLNQHDNVSKIIIILVQNPICDKGGTAESYCSESIFNITYTAPPSTCLPVTCSSDQILSPTCKCAYPYTGILIFRTGYFLDNEKQGGLEKSLMDEFKVNHLPVDSVSLSNLTTDQIQYVKLSIQIFPSGQDRFNETGVISIAYLLSTQTHNQFFFIGNAYQHFGSYRPAKNRAYWGIIVLSSLGFFVFGIGVWRLHKIIRKRRIQKRKEKYFKQNGGLLLQQKLSSGQVKFDNTKLFNSKDLEKATDRFNVNRVLGKGGQGTVYKGMLVDGQIVAVKKFKVKGNVEEFINEVLILSQINHRNVVKLLGFCLETEVPLLVYEFIPNGTLSEYLHQQNEDLPMTWEKRLQIAIEVAEALFYLHSSASQPIYHRDIKSTNILLNEKYKAKVADFGTSRMVAIEDTHLTTLVQGTFGYLDPEYFHTSQFTAKSDVFSFGVVLAELLTGQKPISSERPEEAKGLASYFIMCMEENSLFDVIDKRIMEVEKGQIMAVANLAKRCLELNGRKRPTMREVTMELEGIQKYRKSSSMQQNLEKVQFFGGLDYDKLKLYSYQRSSCSSQVRIALKLKGLKYEDKTMKGEQSDPEFLKLNPIGSVPVLMDEDVVISDSFAIIMYLEEKFPQRPLLPYDIQKRAANIVSSNIQPFQNLSLQKYVEEKVSPHEKLPLLKSVITEGLTALEIILKDHAGRYATGDEIFLADLFLAPQLDAAMRFNIDMTEFPILERLNETYNEIPAFREALLWESDCINFKF